LYCTCTANLSPIFKNFTTCGNAPTKQVEKEGKSNEKGKRKDDKEWK
jgi:hypothetical protein